jgi:hypothetical protein
MYFLYHLLLLLLLWTAAGSALPQVPRNVRPSRKGPDHQSEVGDWFLLCCTNFRNRTNFRNFAQKTDQNKQVLMPMAHGYLAPRKSKGWAHWKLAIPFLVYLLIKTSLANRKLLTINMFMLLTQLRFMKWFTSNIFVLITHFNNCTFLWWQASRNEIFVSKLLLTIFCILQDEI